MSDLGHGIPEAYETHIKVAVNRSTFAASKQLLPHPLNTPAICPSQQATLLLVLSGELHILEYSPVYHLFVSLSLAA